jgi:hypothetical protein
VGFGGLDWFERLGMWEMREKWEKGCMVQGENEMGKGENDLKRGHVRPLNECARSHQGACDHTRAKACTMCGVRSCAQGCTVGVRSSAHQCALDRTHARVCVKIGPLCSSQCVWARA